MMSDKMMSDEIMSDEIMSDEDPAQIREELRTRRQELIALAADIEIQSRRITFDIPSGYNHGDPMRRTHQAFRDGDAKLKETVRVSISLLSGMLNMDENTDQAIERAVNILEKEPPAEPQGIPVQYRISPLPECPPADRRKRLNTRRELIDSAAGTEITVRGIINQYTACLPVLEARVDDQSALDWFRGLLENLWNDYITRDVPIRRNISHLSRLLGIIDNTDDAVAEAVKLRERINEQDLSPMKGISIH